MQILDLAGGGASLEFASAEAPAVLKGLRKLGAVRTEQGAMYDGFELEGEHLIYYFEWDEPCLISSTAGGVGILRKLAAELTHLRAA